MLVLVPLLAVLEPVAGLTAADMEALARGEVPVKSESFVRDGGKAAGRGVGAIVVDRAIAEVWTHLSRYDDKADYVPRLEVSRVIDRLPDRVRVQMVVDASIMKARYTAWYVLDEAGHTIHWTLDKTAEGNTVRDVDGDYRLFPVAPDRTLVVYRTFVDSGRAVPGFIQSYLAKRSIPNLLRAIKKRVESGGTWKK